MVNYEAMETAALIAGAEAVEAAGGYPVEIVDVLAARAASGDVEAARFLGPGGETEDEIAALNAEIDEFLGEK